MPKKLTYEEVKKVFVEQGCELLEKDYINNSTIMKYKCSCGGNNKISLSNFKKGQRCKKCGSKKKIKKLKFSYEYVKQYFKDQGCELLEKEYINSDILMKYKCSCGNISKINFNSFRRGRKCKKCGGIEKPAYNYVKQYFNDQGCILLEKKYKNNKTPMKYKCICGNISKISFSNFKRGKRCRCCGKNEKLTYKYVKQYFKDNNCELLEKKYVNCAIKMRYKCNCGNMGEICFSSFYQGNRCKKCGIEKRTGKNHSNYNHNKTDEERKIERKFPEYYKWRTEIYKKNNYTCQCCFQRGGILNAHHILNYASNKKLRLDIDNGITLCKFCHKEFHKIYGKKDNNKKQLDEFFKVGDLCLKSG